MCELVNQSVGYSQTIFSRQEIYCNSLNVTHHVLRATPVDNSSLQKLPISKFDARSLVLSDLFFAIRFSLRYS
jgi:hypothetical protein